MAAFSVAFAFSLALYLILTAGSGSIFLWSSSELAAGIVLSALSAALTSRLIGRYLRFHSFTFLNPMRWIIFAAYAFGPFLWNLTKANLDVAYRVITGRIKPGIVKIETGLKNDGGLALLANSITLTPGTLSVDTGPGRSLYVHCINLKSRKPEPEEVCGSFIKWARRITE